VEFLGKDCEIPKLLEIHQVLIHQQVDAGRCHCTIGSASHHLDLNLIQEWIEDRLSYDPSTNTVFMDFAGMRLRQREDVDRIKTAVDALLGPLGKRVNSIVNYDRFEAAPDIMPDYLDLVRYVQERYYLKVSRYTTSGFMRLKMGKELERRQVPPRLPQPEGSSGRPALAREPMIDPHGRWRTAILRP
jgi:hypothetical protein